MEPFQIICPSCAAKLKVKNPSAIGQRLACPKCREMILVEAPEGHSIGKSVVATSGFDDIDLDSILENKPVSPKKPKRAKTTASAPRKKSKPTAEIILAPKARAKTVSDPKPAPSNELDPTEDWVNPTTKKKQRLVLTLMAVVGAVLLSAVGIIAIVSLASDDPSVAQVGDPSDLESALEPELEGSEQFVADDDEDLGSDGSLVEEIETADVESVVANEPPPIVPDLPPDVETESSGVDVGSAAETNTVPNDPPSKANSIPDVPSEIDEETEKLRQILAESGTSLLALQGAAATVRSLGQIGTPKYFFEKSKLPEINFNRAKDQILLEVSYTDLPLQTVMHELSLISGLVVAIDVPAMIAANVELNPKVNLKIENQSTADVIRAVAESVSLVATETDNGFWISSKASADNIIEKRFDVSTVAEDEEAVDRLIQVIKRTVYPSSWKHGNDSKEQSSNESNGDISFEQGLISVKNSAVVVAEVAGLIESLRKLEQEVGNKLLTPIPSLARGNYLKPFVKTNSIRVPLSSFVQRMADEYGTRVIIDWHSLSQFEWTPGSMAPGIIDEPTVGDVINEMIHAMGVAVYVIDEKTVWLTLPEIANNLFDSRVYRIDKLASGKLDPPRLDRILRNALGNQLFQPGVAVELLPSGEYALVRAPQFLHYQFEAVVAELERPRE